MMKFFYLYEICILQSNEKKKKKQSLASATSRISHPSLATPHISQSPLAKVFYNVIETLSAASRCNSFELSYRQELHQAGIYSDSEKTSKIFNIDCVYKSLR